MLFCRNYPLQKQCQETTKQTKIPQPESFLNYHTQCYSEGYHVIKLALIQQETARPTLFVQKMTRVKMLHQLHEY